MLDQQGSQHLERVLYLVQNIGLVRYHLHSTLKLRITNPAQNMKCRDLMILR